MMAKNKVSKSQHLPTATLLRGREEKFRKQQMKD
jgi:hypothetical protein